jgi:diguanylate cyclase (GGDEF)-like protein
LAQAYWKTGDAQQAQHYAQRAIDNGIKNEYTEALVGAYNVLYQVAQQQGDYKSALAWHEKFAAADKGYLNLTSARMLAYQMVHQQVQAKKMQVDSLSKQNQVLQLRQQVSDKAAVTRKLSILLLLTVLGSIAFWAWRTKRSELKFMTLARRDGLTGIFNRQYFLEAGEELLAYSARSTRDACVVVIDLDHFKLINDTHGHAMGDMVLKSAVTICQAHLRSVDVFGRTGGEEFAIAMPDCDLEEAMHLAERLRRAIAGLFSADEGTAFPVHASFGVAATSCSGHQLKQLMAHADSALYQAKREGRNRVVVFNSAVGISGGQVEETVERRQA